MKCVIMYFGICTFNGIIIFTSIFQRQLEKAELLVLNQAEFADDGLVGNPTVPDVEVKLGRQAQLVVEKHVVQVVVLQLGAEDDLEGGLFGLGGEFQLVVGAVDPANELGWPLAPQQGLALVQHELLR